MHAPSDVSTWIATFNDAGLFTIFAQPGVLPLAAGS